MAEAARLANCKRCREIFHPCANCVVMLNALCDEAKIIRELATVAVEAQWRFLRTECDVLITTMYGDVANVDQLGELSVARNYLRCLEDEFDARFRLSDWCLLPSLVGARRRLASLLRALERGPGGVVILEEGDEGDAVTKETAEVTNTVFY